MSEYKVVRFYVSACDNERYLWIKADIDAVHAGMTITVYKMGMEQVHPETGGTYCEHQPQSVHRFADFETWKKHTRTV